MKIKTRAWDGEQMVSPDYISRNGRAHWKANSIPTYSDNVMQYTGLKDKTGKEIYEGDILERYSGLAPKGSNPMIRSAVTWHIWHWEGIKAWKEAKVIGNIYENLNW